MEGKTSLKVRFKIPSYDYGDGIAWERKELLGRGSFGSVYLAMLKLSKLSYTCLPVVMAVKSAEFSASGSIQKELEILRNIGTCSSIIECYGEESTVGNNGLMAYNLLLEYASGGTLGERIKNSRRKKLSELEARKHTRSILEGLVHIHKVGYVHCDLKPDNVLMVLNPVKQSFEFRAKIGDFGLAKRVTAENRKRKLGSYWRGTSMYLSPETVLEGIQEPPSDIWALGCVVLEMLIGNPAWDRNNELDVDDILRKIGEKQEIPVIPRKLSENARSFLNGCFVRDPKYRWTAGMLLQHPFVQGLVDDDKADKLEIKDGDGLGSDFVSSDREKASKDGLLWPPKVDSPSIKRMRKGEEVDSKFADARHRPFLVRLKIC